MMADILNFWKIFKLNRHISPLILIAEEKGAHHSFSHQIT